MRSDLVACADASVVFQLSPRHARGHARGHAHRDRGRGRVHAVCVLACRPCVPQQV